MKKGGVSEAFTGPFFPSKISRSFMLLITVFFIIVVLIATTAFYAFERNFIFSSASERADTIFTIVKNTFYYHIMPFGDVNFFKAYYEHLNETSPFLKIRVVRGEGITRQFGIRHGAEPVKKKRF